MFEALGPGERRTTPAYNISATDFMNSTTPAYSSVEPRGCPYDYDWCYNTPIIKFYQFIIGFTLLVCAYSVANVMSFAIYSKLLGPKPQVIKSQKKIFLKINFFKLTKKRGQWWEYWPVLEVYQELSDLFWFRSYTLLTVRGFLSSLSELSSSWLTLLSCSHLSDTSLINTAFLAP